MIMFVRFTTFAWGQDNVAPDVWVNPTLVTHIRERTVTSGRQDVVQGSLIYFSDNGQPLELRQSVHEVVDMLRLSTSPPVPA